MNKNQHLPLLLLLVTLHYVPFSAEAQTLPFGAGTPVTGMKVFVEDVTAVPSNLNSNTSTTIPSGSNTQVGNKLTSKRPSSNTPAAAPAQKNTGVLLNDANFFNDGYCTKLLPAARGLLAAQIKKELLAKANGQLPSGIGLHSETNIQLGEGCITQSYFIGSSTPQVTTEITIPRVRLFVRITTPDGVSGALDPNFVVYFDLVATSARPLPTHTSQADTAFRKRPLTLQVKNISRPETKSLTGNLIIAANNLIDIMGGPDFIELLRKNDQIKTTFEDVGDGIDYTKIKALLTGKPPMRVDSYSENGILVLKATNKENKTMVN